MSLKPIRISEPDYSRIKLLMAAVSGARASKTFARLNQELATAIIVPVLPSHVVGIGSYAEIADLDSGEVDCFTLTWPEQANAEQGRLSVLAPLGAAIFGFSEGDDFSWEMPGGVRRLHLRKVSKPAVVGVPVTA